MSSLASQVEATGIIETGRRINAPLVHRALESTSMYRPDDLGLPQDSEPVQQPILENPQGVQTGPDFYNKQAKTSRQFRSRTITVTMVFAFIITILFNGAAAFHWQDLRQENTQIEQEIATTLNESSRL